MVATIWVDVLLLMVIFAPLNETENGVPEKPTPVIVNCGPTATALLTVIATVREELSKQRVVTKAKRRYIARESYVVIVLTSFRRRLLRQAIMLSAH